MNVLAENIESGPSNYTRFFVLHHKDASPTGRDKTSVIFTLSHEPGSLHRALGEFAARKINLAKIESRPTRMTPWEYHFYLDFEGHRVDVKPKAALNSLQRHTSTLKVLGSYPAAVRVD